MPGFSKATRTRFLFLPALALLWLATAPGVAQEAAALPGLPASRAEPSWGTLDTTDYTLGPCDALVRTSFTAVFGNCDIVKPSVSLGFTSLAFPVHLPNGALLEAVEMNYFDNYVASNPTAGFYRNGSTGVSELLFLMNPPPTSGGNASTTFTPPVPLQIDNVGTSYVILLLLHLDSATEYEGLYNYSVKYRLQVSPAPQSATFGDVPIGHVFHRYVEALAASGITVGCGGGNFCVDDPLTRGQMAVFLSVALGLHFPN